MRNVEWVTRSEECGFFGFKTKKRQKIWCNQKLFVILQPLTKKSEEGWQSDRSRWTRNPVYPFRVSGVWIPHLPQKEPHSPLFNEKGTLRIPFFRACKSITCIFNPLKLCYIEGGTSLKWHKQSLGGYSGSVSGLWSGFGACWHTGTTSKYTQNKNVSNIKTSAKISRF